MSNVTIQNATIKGMQAITPNDTTNIDERYGDSLFINGTAGDVEVIFKDGTTFTFTNLPSQSTINAMVTRVRAAGTTATGIFGLKLYP